jgi:4'-phosphopantetheinyl transferase
LADSAAVPSTPSGPGDRPLRRRASLPEHASGRARVAAGVELWSERLDDRGAAGTSHECLDAAELVRAGRYRFERDRRRFVARRVFLRRVLARYLDIAPKLVRYEPDRSWPELEQPTDLVFSTSHAAGLAIVAVARNRRLGVDVEQLRPIPQALDLARSLFARAEVDHLGATARHHRSAAFLRLWTRKEAYVKALRVGLSMPLDTFAVLEDAVPTGQEAGAGERFELASLEVLPGYVGSVAVSVGGA